MLCSGYALAGNLSIHGKQAAADYTKVEKALTHLGGIFARKQHLDKHTAFVLLSGYLKMNPEIYGAAFAFAPMMKDGKLVKSSPYVCRSGNRLTEKDLIATYLPPAP